MVTPPSIITDTAGRTVVVKTGTGALGDRRRQEADVLGRSRHPGVVELVDLVDDGDHVELRLDHVPGPPIALHPPLSAAELARVGAAVAETLADLHHTGIAHGHVAADHVLLADDRVVLCGLADAGAADQTTAPADVVALCRLVRRQLDRAVEAGVVARGDPTADRLRSLTDDIVAHGEIAREGAAPPSARRLAASLAEIADEAPGPGRSRLVSRFGFDGRTVAIATVVIGLTAAAALILIRTVAPGDASATAEASEPALASTAPPPATAPTSDDPATTAGTPTTAAPATAPASGDAAATAGPSTTAASATSTSRDGQDDDPSLVLAAPTSCAPVGAGWSAADIDGDGCPDRWRVTDGVLEVGVVRYALGAPHDLLAVGDWDCDGTATPALVAIESGGVFLFPRWAAEDAAVTVEAVGVVPAPSAAAVASLDGCDVLEVTGAEGVERFGGTAR